MEPRFCSNCRAEIPPYDETCPACGVFAGDVFDGKMPGRPRRIRWVFGFLAIAILTTAAGLLLLQRRAQPTVVTAPQPIAVVSDRPGGSKRAAGAVVNEAEAIRLLRRHLVATGLKSECVVISSQGVRENLYRLTAIDRCEETRLGRWVVDGKTQDVRRD
jgi:hypothetical protein